MISHNRLDLFNFKKLCSLDLYGASVIVNSPAPADNSSIVRVSCLFMLLNILLCMPTVLTNYRLFYIECTKVDKIESNVSSATAISPLLYSGVGLWVAMLDAVNGRSDSSLGYSLHT